MWRNFFLWIVNYNRYMWKKRAHKLAPQTKLYTTKVKFRRADVVKNKFLEMNKIAWQFVLLSYPNFIEQFIIQKDASKIHLRGEISQNWKQISFYSLKLTPTKISYTSIERELLNTVETLREFYNIFQDNVLLYILTTTISHLRNLQQRVRRWHLLLEEYVRTIKNIRTSVN